MNEDAAPFGAYPPSPFQERMRRLAHGLPYNYIGRKLASVLLGPAGGRTKKPRDVVVFDGQRARLHPYDNICEKRVYLTPQHWDPVERAMLAEAIRRHNRETFVFADIGANVGLYSLFARGVSQEAGRTIKLLCVEPEPVVRARLMYNLKVSGAEADAIVLGRAIAATAGEVDLFVNAKSRGESRLDGAGDCVTVPAQPLLDAFRAAGFDSVDAMKIDIEGAERPALEAFFATAPQALRPRLVILETSHKQFDGSALQLCQQSGYALVLQTRLNAILERNPAAHESSAVR